VHIGISRPPTPPHPIPDVDGGIVAQIAERLGFESIFYGEHPIRPVDQAGIGVHASGIPFFQDTMIMLARATAMTSTIKVGAGVFLAPQHNPIRFAKQLASVDHYSNGRVIVGVGIGWSRTECEVLGGDFDRRWAQTREVITLTKRLWTEETVEHHGEFFDIPPVQLYPQPVSKPWPPVLIGALASERAFQRIVDYGDGWLPAFVTREAVAAAPQHIAESRATLDRLANEAGRDPSTISITAILRGPQVDGDLLPAERVDRSLLTRLADVGVQRVAISMPTITSPDDAAVALERIAEHLL
jgi:probable F420-dependent oxidoreductase